MMDIEYTSVIFISVDGSISTGGGGGGKQKIKGKYPSNIFKARSASGSVAKMTVPNPRDLPSGPRTTSARMIVPACRNKSFRSCH